MVYNGEDVISPTLDSVHAQDYDGIEYIIIEGASTDKTISLVKKHPVEISRLVSEPDKGIYDAMNKGMQIAKGDYLLFLNAGDALANPTVISEIMALPKADIYYGETMLIDEHRNHLGNRSELTTRQLPDNLNWKSLKEGLVVSHQSFIVKRDLSPPYILNNLSADIDWVIKCLKASDTVIRYDGIISEFLVGGISDQKKFVSLRDRFFVLADHYGYMQAILSHLWFVLRWILKKWS